MPTTTDSRSCLPEGDSVAKDAARLRPVLEGRQIESVYGTAESVRSRSAQILGAEVAGIRTHGKNLLIDFDTGYSLHVHLGMNGRWRISSVGPPPGPTRVSLSTSTHQASCFGAPGVEVDRTPAIDLAIARLGPDLLGDDAPIEEIVRRARQVEAESLGELLLNQRVAAGIGNVYKSELAFIFRIHPETPVSGIDDRTLGDIYSKAITLLRANLGPGVRTTTGDRGKGRNTWVYDRRDRPCRRCGSRIVESRLGERVTYSCPGCQPTS